MSEYLARHAQPGVTFDVMTPNGSFHAEEQPGPRRYAAFAAGSGITPVLSIAASVLARDSGSRFQLWYGNTGAARTMFLEEVLALKDRYLARFSVAFVMSREPQEVEWLNGRIDAGKVREFARHDLDVPGTDEFFVCGPGTMGEAVPRRSPRSARGVASTSSTLRRSRRLRNSRPCRHPWHLRGLRWTARTWM